MPVIAGVDGCRGGWIVVKMDTDNHNAIEHCLCANFQEVIDYTNDCERVAVDMPIGLPGDANGRTCDQNAREFLRLHHGTRQAVFTAPALGSVQPIVYEGMQALIAVHMNINAAYRRIYNAGIAIQAICLFNKLYEVNIQYVDQIIEALNIKEFHPELAWSERANGAVLMKKKTLGGQQQRIQILVNKLHINIDMNSIAAIRIACGCRNVAKDDIIDAMGGLLAAQDMINNHNNCISSEQVSANGLGMEIWY